MILYPKKIHLYHYLRMNLSHFKTRRQNKVRGGQCLMPSILKSRRKLSLRLD